MIDVQRRHAVEYAFAVYAEVGHDERPTVECAESFFHRRRVERILAPPGRDDVHVLEPKSGQPATEERARREPVGVEVAEHDEALCFVARRDPVVERGAGSGEMIGKVGHASARWRTVSSVSISATGLSCRQRTMRGKRSA